MCGRAHAQRAIPSLKLGKIDNQREKNAQVKGDPKPDTRRHRRTVSCREADGNGKPSRIPVFSRALGRSS